jgi:protein-L-isoaspartate(D-aspartate) O-methyltransferase
MAGQRASLDEIRGFYARLMAAASRSGDPRLERVFELVPREAFLPPGPWKISVDRTYIDTPSADPVYLYQNTLVAIDPARRINNGEPFLHAAWLGAVEPKSGEIVCQIGAGTGYYTAILATLVLPGGRVEAFEIDEPLGAAAERNLAPFENARIVHADASRAALPECDLIYVNAGVLAPPVSWLEALRPGGRMIFPWRPSETVGLALLLSRHARGFAVRPLMPCWFIPCIGGSEGECLRAPHFGEARSVRSAWLRATREPDESAVAIYRDLWFSSAPLPGTA